MSYRLVQALLSRKRGGDSASPKATGHCTSVAASCFVDDKGASAGHDYGVHLWGWRWSALVAGAAVAAVLAAAGQWQGGLAGAAVIAIGGFVAPEVSARLRDKRIQAAEHASAERAARAELDRVSGSALQPGAGKPRGGPSFWLRPEQRVVTFVDRPELALLRRWCASQEGPGVALVTGPGGAGKTRLALRLAEELEEGGWLCRRARIRVEGGVVSAVRAVSRGPVLLIVDYAETRPGLADLLSAACGDTGRLCVLLIARAAGEWWGELEGTADADVQLLVREAMRLPVGVLAGEVGSGAELVRAAVPEFARVIGTPVPELADVVVPSGSVPVLVLHATALLAVLDARDKRGAAPVRVVADDEVLGGLLSREKMFWLSSARTAGLAGPGGVDSLIAAQAVAIACLIAVSDEGSAAQVLRRIPGMSDASSGILRQIARWVRQLYPPDRAGDPARGARWWGSLQPDLLAEQHVITVLADAPDLAEASLRDLTPDQAAEALTLLARVTGRHPAAAEILERALRADLSGLGVPAVQVAAQTGGGLGRVLADVLGDARAALKTLIQVQEAIPYPTAALAEANAVVTGRINQILPADTTLPETARWSDELGSALRQAGHLARAVPPAKEAVRIYRQLVAADPGTYRPDLAKALTNLGLWYFELDRPEEALPASREAADIYSELAADLPDQYRPWLANALCNQGVDLSELGRPGEALNMTREAISIYRDTAEPHGSRRGLARALNNLGVDLAHLGRTAEAIPAVCEGIGIYRELAITSRDRYAGDLAHSLATLGHWHSQLGQLAEATVATQEAADIYRELAAAIPARYGRRLVHALTCLDAWYTEQGRYAEAATAREEAQGCREDIPKSAEDRRTPPPS